VRLCYLVIMLHSNRIDTSDTNVQDLWITCDFHATHGTKEPAPREWKRAFTTDICFWLVGYPNRSSIAVATPSPMLGRTWL
jgi:hypothetical protein